MVKMFKTDLCQNKAFMLIENEVSLYEEKRMLEREEANIEKFKSITELEDWSKKIVPELLRCAQITDDSELLKYLVKLLELPKLYLEPSVSYHELLLFKESVEALTEAALTKRIEENLTRS